MLPSREHYKSHCFNCIGKRSKSASWCCIEIQDLALLYLINFNLAFLSWFDLSLELGSDQLEFLQIYGSCEHSDFAGAWTSNSIPGSSIGYGHDDGHNGAIKAPPIFTCIFKIHMFRAFFALFWQTSWFFWQLSRRQSYCLLTIIISPLPSKDVQQLFMQLASFCVHWWEYIPNLCSPSVITTGTRISAIRETS